MALKLITAPASEPVSLDEVKLHLRVDGTDEDSLITGLMLTARKDIETMTRHALITQTWDWVMDGFPASEIEFPFPPLQSVTGVYYTDDDGVEATFASSNYIVDTYSTPGRLRLKNGVSWPGVTLQEINGVRIRFVCGFGDNGSDVDVRAVQALKLLTGHYYENREASTNGRGGVNLIPQGVDALLADLRNAAISF